jgi:hypothetical protein
MKILFDFQIGSKISISRVKIMAAMMTAATAVVGM